MSDFIFTIESDEEETYPPPHDKPDLTTKTKPVKAQSKRKLDDQHTLELNPGLLLDGLGFDPNSNFEVSSLRSQLLNQLDNPLERFKKKNSAPRVSLDEIIARHQKPDDPLFHNKHESEDWEDDSSVNQDSSNGTNDNAEERGDDVDPSDVGEDNEDEDSDDDDDDDNDRSDEDENDGQSNEADSTLADQAEDLPSDTDDEFLKEEKKDKEKTAVDQNEDPSTQEYFDQSVVPFGAATKEELTRDTHEQPFSSLPGAANLSRPILLGLSSMAITTPTPIQRQAIPLGLLGKDLVCSSVTGSGKTLGYMVPIVERLMWRDKRGGGRTRVMVLTPTRELAVQVFQVGKSLARFTDLTFSLCVGGMDLRAQEVELRERPEIIIGTPGRVIDHVRNTRGFSLETLEILVIDEADRILEEGFQDELEEIIRNCPRSRQTMLFSATVNESVADLAKLSLDKPVRIKIDPPKSTALGLTQEFLKVKQSSHGKKSSSLFDLTRQATLVALCKTSAFSQGKTIIFFRSKAGAHRMKIIFSLFSLKAEELHGNLSQQQRLLSLQKFKQGQTSYLLATDLASRGLDIKGVERVINFEPPTQYDVYLHRIGRTARAGTKGVALTLVGESDRKLIKEARKNCLTSQGAIKQHRIDSDLVKRVQNEIEKMSDTIAEIIREEKEDKEIKKSEMELKKCSNLIQFDEEIKSRPARTWFQSESDKKLSKQIGTTAHTARFTPAVNSNKSLLRKNEKKDETKNNKKRDRFEGLSRKQKRRKMGQEEDAKEKVLIPAINSSIRAAKKAQRPIKITASQAEQNKKNLDLISLNKKKLKKSKTGGNKKNNKKSKSSSSLEMLNKKSAHSSSETLVKKSSLKKKK